MTARDPRRRPRLRRPARQADLEALNAEAIDPFREEAEEIYSQRAAELPAPSLAATFSYALLGALLSPIELLFGEPAGWGLLAAVFIAPFAEEFVKPLGLIRLLSTRPYLAPDRGSVIVSGVLCGIVFAAIENILYGYVYLSHLPPAELAETMRLRWMLCLPLHAVCSGITSAGIAAQLESAKGRYLLRSMPVETPSRVRLGVDHRELMRTEQPLFDWDRGARYYIAAVAIHGAYNLAVTILGV